eukprot:jgi/Undpi1/9737/HiC_scaffold_27.g12193.m1
MGRMFNPKKGGAKATLTHTAPEAYARNGRHLNEPTGVGGGGSGVSREASYNGISELGDEAVYDDKRGGDEGGSGGGGGRGGMATGISLVRAVTGELPEGFEVLGEGGRAGEGENGSAATVGNRVEKGEDRTVEGVADGRAGSASALIDFERRDWEGRGAAPGTGRGAFREGRGWCPGSLLWALALVVVEVVVAVVVVAFSFILPAGYGDLLLRLQSALLARLVLAVAFFLFGVRLSVLQ